MKRRAPLSRSGFELPAVDAPGCLSGPTEPRGQVQRRRARMSGQAPWGLSHRPPPPPSKDGRTRRTRGPLWEQPAGWALLTAAEKAAAPHLSSPAQGSLAWPGELVGAGLPEPWPRPTWFGPSGPRGFHGRPQIKASKPHLCRLPKNWTDAKNQSSNLSFLRQ